MHRLGKVGDKRCVTWGGRHTRGGCVACALLLPFVPVAWRVTHWQAHTAPLMIGCPFLPCVAVHSKDPWPWALGLLELVSVSRTAVPFLPQCLAIFSQGPSPGLRWPYVCSPWSHFLYHSLRRQAAMSVGADSKHCPPCATDSMISRASESYQGVGGM